MEPFQFFIALLTAFSIPSAITGIIVRSIEKRIEKREKEREEKNTEYRKLREERERQQEQGLIHIMRGVDSAIALGEATARAVQRIPDAHCNGDMKAALEYAEKIKHDRKDWLTEQTIHAIY